MSLLLLLFPCSQVSSLPALAVCVDLGFLCIFPRILMLVCRLDSELPNLQWSLFVATLLVYVCPVPVAWMS